MPVTQLVGVAITVADLAGAAAFYRDVLGLDVGPEHALPDPAWSTVLGLGEVTTRRAVDIKVGRQWIELVAFDPPGKPYPRERASNDQWFQHCALVCGDISAVWRRLDAASPGVVTDGEPVLLPPNTGSVTAFKFRDPEGHPLELISFPPGVGDPVWQEPAADGIRGCDHTAIAVSDVDRSIAFYTGLLGLRVAGRSLNQGPDQDRLDGLSGCEVDVVALAPAAVATPHVELCTTAGRRGGPRPRRSRPRMSRPPARSTRSKGSTRLARNSRRRASPSSRRVSSPWATAARPPRSATPTATSSC